MASKNKSLEFDIQSMKTGTTQSPTKPLKIIPKRNKDNKKTAKKLKTVYSESSIYSYQLFAWFQAIIFITIKLK